MLNQYKIVKENIDGSGDVYGTEKFKALPFKDDRTLSLINLGNIARNYAFSFQSFIKEIEYETYGTFESGAKNFYATYKLTRPDISLKTSFIKNFSQFALLADEAGVDYSLLTERFNILINKIDKSFTFIKDIAYFHRDFSIIAEAIHTSLNNPVEMVQLKEEMEQLKSKYQHIADNLIDLKNLDINLYTADFINDFNQIKNELKSQIIAKDYTKIYSLSEIYHKELQDTSGEITQFLIDKKFEDSIKTRITLSQSQKIQDYIVFTDDSVAYKKGGVLKPIESSQDHSYIFGELERSIIAYQLRKKPKMAKYVDHLYRDSYNELENVIIMMDTFISNEQILKNMNMDISVFEDKNFEAMDDYMHDLIAKHKLHQYANSILSSKNKDLLSDKALESFKVLQETGVSKKTIQDMIGKKMAAIKTVDDFEKYLNKVVAHFSEFNKDVLAEKLSEAKIKPVYNENNVIVFQVQSFDHSKKLGSPSWCISRQESYFKDYTRNGESQYFLYDFNKDEKHNESMIGFTIKKNGDIRTTHLKNDDYSEPDADLKVIINKIIYKEQSNYTLKKEKIDELKAIFEPNKKNTLKV